MPHAHVDKQGFGFVFDGAQSKKRKEQNSKSVSINPTPISTPFQRQMRTAHNVWVLHIEKSSIPFRDEQEPTVLA
jgi:hypothetical protein